MSRSDSVLDPQVADAIATINAMVLAATPSMAAGSQMINVVYAQSLAAYNAVFAQQQAYITGQSAAVAGVIAILGPGFP